MVHHRLQGSLQARRPVAFFSNGLGDHLLTLPALRALAALFPQRIELVCLRDMQRLFFADVPLRASYEAEMLNPPRGGGFDAEELAAQIGPCDLFLSLVPWHSSAMDRLIARLAPAHSIGFCSAFDENCGPGEAAHSADVAFTLPRRLDPALRVEDFAWPPSWPAEAVERASAIRRQIPADMRVLVVHADTSRAKMWPAEAWRCFLDVVLSRFTRFVALVVGRVPLPIVPERHRHRVAQCHDLSLGAAMALVGQADIFAGIDSCMLHAADLCGVRGIGLFGPTDPAEFGFRFAHHRHVLGRAGMPSIIPEAVIEAFEQLAQDVEHRRLESIATGMSGRE